MFTQLFAATAIVAAVIFAFSLQQFKKDTTENIRCSRVERSLICEH